MPCTRPSFVRPSGVLVDERAEARIPRPPLPHSRALRAPMTQPLSLGVHSCTKASHAGFHTLCQAFGRADEMGQAALPEPFPGLIEPIAITDQDTRPVNNELHQGCLGAVGVD